MRLVTASALPRTVLVLSLVSLLNDAASEMITPLLPVFLTLTLGAGPAVVGLVEGLAEATSSILKFISGRLADRGWNAKALVLTGYGVSNTVRPLIGVALGWPFVLLLRFLDRIGKGLRTSPRDALIAGSVTLNQRGTAFGFHRAMDHAGAVIGPLAAFLVLRQGWDINEVFFLSVIPGIAVILLLALGLPRGAHQLASAAPPPALNWSSLDRRLRGLIVASGGLALATLPEAFLVLWAASGGLKVAFVPLLWAAASLAKMFVALAAGAFSDRVGRLPVVVGGWTLRVASLLAIAFFPDGTLTTWTLFILFAASLAATEAAERSLVGDSAAPNQRATAYGLYHLVCGLLALPGAIIIGATWQLLGQQVAFLLAAGLTAASAAALLGLSRERQARQPAG